MQPTPAPSSVPGSPKEPEVEVTEYNPPPPNVGEPVPFSVLAALFEKLAVERRHDKRRKLLDAWFTVSYLSCDVRNYLQLLPALAHPSGSGLVPSPATFASTGMVNMGVGGSEAHERYRKTESALYMASRKRIWRRRTSNSSHSECGILTP